MSVQLGLWDDGSNQPENGLGGHNLRASLNREMRYLLTISTETSGGGRLSPAGLAHSMGVCLTEGWVMARGKDAGGKSGDSAGMPRFVDVKLDQAQKAAFLEFDLSDAQIIDRIQQLAFTGHRFGCAWSGEQQAYTVSVTCRNPESPNNGLCMTSFARFMKQAMRLALFKHDVVTRGVWVVPGTESVGDFG